DEIVMAAPFELLFENFDDPRMMQFRHPAGAAKKAFTARAVFRMLAVENLDRDQPVLVLVPGFPDGSKSSSTEDFEKMKTAVAEAVVRLQPGAVPDVTADLDDLLADVFRALAGERSLFEQALRRLEIVHRLLGRCEPVLRLRPRDPPDQPAHPLL